MKVKKNSKNKKKFPKAKKETKKNSQSHYAFTKLATLSMDQSNCSTEFFEFSSD